jgi:sigma54-dependent transcription regulator
MTNESFNFELLVKGSITLDEETQEVTSKFIVINRDTRDGETLETQLAERLQTMGSPVRLFQDNEQLQIWFRTAVQKLLFHLPRILAEETSMSLRDQANAALNALKIETLDMKDIVDDHLRDTADRIKDTLDMQRMGQQSAWTKLRLKRAIRREVASLPKQERTLKKVSERLLSAYPDAAPASSDSLRKLITRFDLDWRELRNGQ